MSDDPVSDLAAATENLQVVGTVQVRALNRAIQADPGAPVHYLLRGEEWLSCGEVARARSDFETVLDRVTALLDQSDWGYIYQAYIDRALVGLRRCGA